MSVTTSTILNGDQLQALLPDGASFSSAGGLLGSADEKVITFWDTDDETGQAAVSAAATAYATPSDAVTVQMDPAAIAAIQAAAQKATTVAAIRAAFISLTQHLQDGLET